MKKKCNIFIIIIFLSIPSFAETILLFTQNECEEFNNYIKNQQYAVEDSVMSSFFDAGHIIFNSGISKENGYLSVPSERLSYRLAKESGAELLLEIKLNYKRFDELEKVDTANFNFINVNEGKVLYQGELSISEFVSNDSKKGKQIIELCKLLGENLASGALSKVLENSF